VGSGVIARAGDPASLEGGVQRFIGVVLGAVATFLVLLVTSTSIVADQNKGYLIAVVVGAIVAWLWPWVIGMILVRRARSRQDERMHKQVEKEMAERDAAAKR
jgi:mannitol-specific phosphotransferase system IIBC component